MFVFCLIFQRSNDKSQFKAKNAHKKQKHFEKGQTLDSNDMKFIKKYIFPNLNHLNVCSVNLGDILCLNRKLFENVSHLTCYIDCLSTLQNPTENQKNTENQCVLGEVLPNLQTIKVFNFKKNWLKNANGFKHKIQIPTTVKTAHIDTIQGLKNVTFYNINHSQLISFLCVVDSWKHMEKYCLPLAVLFPKLTVLCINFSFNFIKNINCPTNHKTLSKLREIMESEKFEVLFKKHNHRISKNETETLQNAIFRQQIPNPPKCICENKMGLYILFMCRII